MNRPVTALTVAYDGAAFSGFARQVAVPTAQGVLEDALSTVLRRQVLTVGAGRTDAGVHARGQVVSFTSAETDPDARTILRAVGALAAPHVVVSDVRTARPGFSARFDALAREYRFLIVPGPVAPMALRHAAWWVKKDLDIDAMRAGAAFLVGSHDFRSFCVTGSAVDKPTVREVRAIEIEPAVELGESCIAVRILGRSFLHSMVRIIVGSLVDVGRGRRDPAWIAEVLAAGERATAGITAPAHGLTLWSVTYADDVWI
ncbi:MAG: tRNA pseudouridine(38-40) synthase TruA [Coriobacteriia bacterium]|nr:tRNA pseudouridine(38-40) synthase TruA [Coriobacteriia bacterium]